MKLVTKISNQLLFNSFFLFIALGILSFFLIDYILESEVNEQLVRTKDMIIQKGFDRQHDFNSLALSIQKVGEQRLNEEEVFSDTLIFNNTENENEEFRQLTTYAETSYGFYKITVRASLFEKEDLLITILLAFLFVYLVLFLSLYIVNRKTTEKIFKPFHKILGQLKSFRLSNDDNFYGSASSIDEFKLLNENLISLTKRVSNEYRLVREFTENASHEIQNPLAVIKSKLELLIQNEKLNEEQIGLVQTMMKSVNRLARLNKSLLLLTKIEGSQFRETEEINLQLLLEKELPEFSELAALNGISMEAKIVSSHVVKVNKELLSIMIRNILSNAVIHNIKNGVIRISLSNLRLNVENSGTKLNVVPEKLFERFSKGDSSSGSVGLGLAIVKQICDLYNFRISYIYENEFHKISIEFI